jgi:hypothetical protein
MATATTSSNNTDAGMHAKTCQGETASDVAATIGEKANEATAAVGGGMKSLAGAIRDHTPKDGAVGSASSSLAESLENGGRYLQEEGLGGMATDITNLVRRNPIPALLVGLGIGFVLAKITTSSLNHGN